MSVAPLEMDENSRPPTSAATEPASVELAEADIPGAALDEPDVHSVAVLRWWLQFHGIKLVRSCMEKQQSILRLDPLV